MSRLQQLFSRYVALPFLLTACTSDPYRTLRSTYDHAQSTISTTAQQSPTTPATSVTDPALDNIRQTILTLQKHWQHKPETSESDDDRVTFQASAHPDYRALGTASDLDQQLERGLPLETLLGLVRERNPAVNAAAQHRRARIQQYPQVAYLDTILRQYNAFTKQLRLSIGPPHHKQTMTDAFPFPNTLALKGKIVSADVDIAQYQHEITIRDSLTNMRETYYGYLFVEQAITINRENQRFLEQMLRVAQTKIRTDKATYRALLTAQMELSTLANTILTLRERRDVLIAQINTLLNRAPMMPLGRPKVETDTEPALTLQQIETAALTRNQELQQHRLRIAKTELSLELAKQMAYPDPTLGASYFDDRAQPASDHYGDGFSTTPTLNHRHTPWFGQQNAYAVELATTVTGLKNTLTTMENEIRLALKQHHVNMTTARRAIQLYRHSLLPQARQSLEAAAAGYRAGTVDFLTYIDAERTLLRFQLEEERALRDFRSAVAKLEKRVGQRLPQRSLVIAASPEPPLDTDTENTDNRQRKQ